MPLKAYPSGSGRINGWWPRCHARSGAIRLWPTQSALSRPTPRSPTDNCVAPSYCVTGCRGISLCPYIRGKNKLSNSKRVQILEMLVEGMSMRGASRVAKVSINTITKLMVEAGEACAAYHDETVRNVTAERVQCDEIWAFCYAKEKNVARAKAAPRGAGDVWTWTAIEGASKLILSYEVGDRSGQTAHEFMDDLSGRQAHRLDHLSGFHLGRLRAPLSFGSSQYRCRLPCNIWRKAHGEQGFEQRCGCNWNTGAWAGPSKYCHPGGPSVAPQAVRRPRKSPGVARHCTSKRHHRVVFGHTAGRPAHRARPVDHLHGLGVRSCL